MREGAALGSESKPRSRAAGGNGTTRAVGKKWARELQSPQEEGSEAGGGPNSTDTTERTNQISPAVAVQVTKGLSQGSRRGGGRQARCSG